MSYILDAIAKSEQERQQQEVPGAQILALPASRVQQPRRIMLYLVVGALLLNAVLFVVWMQSSQTTPNQSSPAPKQNIDESQNQAIESASQISTAPVGVNIDTASPETVANIERSVLTDELPVGQQKEKSNEISVMTSGLVNEPDLAQLKPESLAVTTDGDTADWIHIGPDTLSSQTGSGNGVESSPGVQEANVMPRKISKISELPGTVRSNLPTVVFSGHLYSSNPESSVVFVDKGRPVKKGRQIADDLSLHEITPTGVIVEFRGYLIEVGVLQNWTLN